MKTVNAYISDNRLDVILEYDKELWERVIALYNKPESLAFRRGRDDYGVQTIGNGFSWAETCEGSDYWVQRSTEFYDYINENIKPSYQRKDDEAYNGSRGAEWFILNC